MHTHTHMYGVVCVIGAKCTHTKEVAVWLFSLYMMVLSVLFVVHMMVVVVYTFTSNPNISCARVSRATHVHIYHTRVGVLTTRHVLMFRRTRCASYHS